MVAALAYSTGVVPDRLCGHSDHLPVITAAPAFTQPIHHVANLQQIIPFCHKLDGALGPVKTEVRNYGPLPLDLAIPWFESIFVAGANQ